MSVEQPSLFDPILIDQLAEEQAAEPASEPQVEDAVRDLEATEAAPGAAPEAEADAAPEVEPVAPPEAEPDSAPDTVSGAETGAVRVFQTTSAVHEAPPEWAPDATPDEPTDATPDAATEPARLPAVPAAPPGLTATSSLLEASRAFEDHMLRQGFSENTIKAFAADLRLFARHTGANRPVGQVGQADLEAFMTWLSTERDVPCSPKSYARRLTTLKVFFGWLAAAEVLPKDPAAPLVHIHPTTPMPEILYDSQISDLLRVTRDLLWAPKPDARPFVLVTLLLQTGIKKGECMEIKLEHIDLSNPQAPVLYIRYPDPRKVLKERRLALGPNLTPAFRQYVREYQPKAYLFECTARNLEYVLGDAAALAEIAGGCSFEQLRWTCAVRDYRNGMTADQLRQKLGLSMITWRETLPKIQKLARPAL
jgi:integrase/recombinase XerD